MKECVVGSKGFIGSRLVRELKIAGHNVIEISSEVELLNLLKYTKKRILIRNLYWCASTVNPASAEKNPESALLEIQKFASFIDSLSKINVTLRIIFLSSGGCTYSGSNTFFSESDDALGINVYGQMKIALENLLADSFANSVCIRVGNAYGQGQPTGRGQGVIAEWLHTVTTSNAVTVFGSLDTVRDYIHVDDLAKCLTMLGDTECRGVLNVSNGYATSLAELHDSFQSAWPKTISINQFTRRDFDRDGYLLDNSKIRKILGWQPQIEIRDGITRLLK